MNISNYGGSDIFGAAKYIKAQEKPSEFSFYDPAPMFRKEFEVDNPREAHVFVQSPGFAKYYINGTDITEDLFISPVSDYNKILWYNEYDVSDLLVKGRNVICVIAGNGFLNESFKSAWDYNTAKWRDAPQFCLLLTVNGEVALISDKSWKCSREDSYIIFNHLRSGEYWDMRKKDVAWMSAGFDNSGWIAATERSEPPRGKLMPTVCPPVRETERIEPRSITPTERGYLVDFGVNVSGYTEICLREQRGTEILLRYTEELDGQGAPKYNNMDSKYFFPESMFQLNKMIASGGTDIFKPAFSYHGFRYLLIENAVNKPLYIYAYFTHNDIGRISEFDSGNEVLNYIYNAGIRSTWSNMFWCLTDCPTREKLGWTNDAQASVEQTLLNFDIVPLYEKWIEDIRASMFPDGSLHGTVPSTEWAWGRICGPVCDCLLYELPYKVYLYTGRSDMLTSSLECFEKYARFLEKKVRDNCEFELGDWMGYGNSTRIPKEFVRDFYLIKALKITALANKLASKDNSVWIEKLDAYTAAFKNRYLNGTGECTLNEQSAIAMLLESGTYDNEDILSRQLVSVVIRDGYKLTCGMVGVQYLYYALSRAGRSDIAYKMITESDPGYRSWLDRGATTLWERWDGFDDGSHNHHMYSGVIAWFYKRLLGISTTEEYPGFEQITLDPSFIKELGHVKGSIDTVRGRIKAQWYFRDDQFVYTVVLPNGIKAFFGEKELMTGKNIFIIDRRDKNEDN